MIGRVDNAEPVTYVEFARELGNNLKRVREAKGLTVEEVAEKAKISTTTYRDYERGRTRRRTPPNPSMLSLLTVLWALGVNWEDVAPERMPDLHPNGGLY